MVTSTEVAVKKSKQAAERMAARLNGGAFSGQRYTVQAVRKGLYGIVLIDGEAADTQPVITYRAGRERESIPASGGWRHYRRMTTACRTFG